MLELVEGRVRCSVSEAQLPQVITTFMTTSFCGTHCLCILFASVFRFDVFFSTFHFFLSLGFNLGEIGLNLEHFFCCIVVCSQTSAVLFLKFDVVFSSRTNAKSI